MELWAAMSQYEPAVPCEHSLLGLPHLQWPLEVHGREGHTASLDNAKACLVDSTLQMPLQRHSTHLPIETNTPQDRVGILLAQKTVREGLIGFFETVRRPSTIAKRHRTFNLGVSRRHTLSGFNPSPRLNHLSVGRSNAAQAPQTFRTLWVKLLASLKD